MLGLARIKIPLTVKVAGNLPNGLHYLLQTELFVVFQIGIVAAVHTVGKKDMKPGVFLALGKMAIKELFEFCFQPFGKN